MSFKIGTRVQFRKMKTCGTVLQGNEDETLVKFDDGDKCAVDTIYLRGISA